jgi:hypothetical protein
MTPAQLAKVTKSGRDLGFTNAEMDACNGDQAALLALFAKERSEESANGQAVVYGAKKPNIKTVKDADDHIAKKVPPGQVAVKKVK